MNLTAPHEPTSATFKTPEQAPVRREPREACIVYIYPTGPLMGSRYSLGNGPVLIGRSDDCQVPNVDASVSRHHARIELRADGNYHVTDLGSTNGTFVNNVMKADSPLRDGDYLRIGNCIYRYLTGDNLEAEYHEEIYRLTVIDALTDIPNRRYFQEFLDRELVRAVRHRRPLALAFLDIDHFKAVNDRMGHIAGDMALRQLVGCVREIVRRDELFARYGGEEFAVVLPELDLPTAAVVCERIRQTVQGHSFVFNRQQFPLTVSIGVGVLAAGEEVGPTELVRRADAMLYEAKRAGRNRVRPAG
jgi:diguanylate cyclase (GGDEF)-like protein